MNRNTLSSLAAVFVLGLAAAALRAQNFADRYEPNNSAGNATSLNAQEGSVDEELLSIYPKGDVDYFRFALSAQGQAAHYLEVQAAMIEPTFGLPGRADVTLFDAQGAELEKKSTPLSYERESVRFSLANRAPGQYLLRVEGRAGLVIGWFNLAGQLPFATGPSITTQPESRTVTAGAPVTFTVEASGTPPLRYQWRKDGADLPGATGATLSLANAQSAHAGSYTVVVSNAGGSITSHPATLTVNPVGPPPGVATRTLPAGYVPGTKFAVQIELTPGNGVTAYGVEDQPPLGWAVSDISDGGEFDAQNRKVKWDPFFTSSNPSKRLTYHVTPPAGANGEARFEGTASFDGLNVAVTGAATVGPGSGGTPPSVTSHPVSQTVAVGSSVTFTVVAGGSGPLTYQWQRDEQDLAGETQPVLTLANVQPTDAGSYRVTVRNAYGVATSNPATLTVNAPGGPPAIAVQPVSQTVEPGGSVTFTVTANGDGPLSYQWRFNRVAIPGATGASLTLSAVRASDAGSYTVVVSNGQGAVISQPAILTVGATAAAPRFTQFEFVPRHGFRFSVSAPPGYRYVMETSTDLRQWIEIVTLDNPGGTLELTDSEATGFRQSFYRVRQLPP